MNRQSKRPASADHTEGVEVGHAVQVYFHRPCGFVHLDMLDETNALIACSVMSGPQCDWLIDALTRERAKQKAFEEAAAVDPRLHRCEGQA